MGRLLATAFVVVGLGSFGCSERTLDFFPPSAAPPEGTAGSTAYPEVPLPPAPAPLYVTGTYDLSEANVPGRACADGGDGVDYRVVALSAEEATLERPVASGCLVPGDEVLLAALQGTAASARNVGRHELLRVLDVDGTRVRFVAAKALFYGASDDSDDEIAERVVTLVRVPSYSRLVVEEEGVLTARAFDGSGGGVLVARVVGDVLVDGLVTMSGRGFRGGRSTEEAEGHGEQGESVRGRGARVQTPNDGGGGGGLGDQTRSGCVQDGNAGGGGAHRVAGAPANVSDLCDGVGVGAGGLAAPGAVAPLFGSGGGSGGRDNVVVDNPPGGAGGAGGGFLWLLGQSLSGGGSIRTSGLDGVGDPVGVECEVGYSTTECFDHSGPGGGGAGGLLRLTIPQRGNVTLLVDGGLGGNGMDTATGNGGDGAPGVLELD